MLPISIANLKDQPSFRGVVAERVWAQWWRKKDVPLATVVGWTDDAIAAAGLPRALVAHDGDRFLGTASVIISDMESRPAYTPWIAAVWVEPDVRGTGIGRGLVAAAAEVAFALGHPTVFLCATRFNAPYYLALGWRRIEEDVDGLDIFVREGAPAAEFG